MDMDMGQSIPAIFDSGVFKPLVPVQLEQGTRVEVGVPEASQSDAPPYDRERWMKFIADMEALPDDSPKDGFSNRDHDRILYGE
jgi:predicted DNA-binding antitoxin AbrB/MazE fold protein